jgi:hypothetical protein
MRTFLFLLDCCIGGGEEILRTFAFRGGSWGFLGEGGGSVGMKMCERHFKYIQTGKIDF